MAAAGTAPLIGVTMDRSPATGASEATYGLRCNYAEALAAAGAHAVLLPIDLCAVATYVALCNGIVLTGSVPGDVGSPARQTFEAALIDAALAEGMPILGICNGMQRIGVALGGTVVDLDRPATGPATDHGPPHAPDRTTHAILVEPDSWLGRLAGSADGPRVNSLHAQVLGPDGRFRVAARAPDGVIEAIEAVAGSYCVGVQWHPEYGLTALDHAIVADFVEECRTAESPSCGVRY